jgi:hypothetical protein
LVPWCPVRAGPDTVRKGSSMARSSQHFLSSGHGIRWVIAQLASAQIWPAEIEEVSNYHRILVRFTSGIFGNDPSHH